jgi:predicted kinase
MKTLIILRGFPGSGKSTRAVELAACPDTVIVSRDGIRTMLDARWQSRHRLTNRFESLTTDIFIEAERMALASDYNVVSDAQHVDNRYEDEIAVARAAGADVRFIDMDMSLDDLLERNRTRPDADRLPDAYIRARYGRYSRTAFMRKSVDDDNLLFRMMSNPNVRVRPVDGEDDVYACNFTRDAFLNHKWDEYTTEARGLFLDGNGKVVMRGFEKFFNIGENEETMLPEVLRKMEYPVRVERKKNGFLGIIGAREDGSLRFYSKSGETDYSALVKRNFERLGIDHAVWRILHDHDATLVCEIVDIDDDRHIIYASESKCWFLHALSNTVDFHIDDAAEAELRDVSPDNWPERYEVADERGLNAAINEAAAADYEGVVLYGANGYMAKVKSNLYLRTKRLRSKLKRALLHGKTTNDAAADDIIARFGASLVYHRPLFDDDDVDMTVVSRWLAAGGSTRDMPGEARLDMSASEW